MNNPVGWFEIYVDDMQRAKAFYQAVFGIEYTPLDPPEGEMVGFPMDMETPGAAGALVKMQGVSPGGGGTMVYFKCDDCAVEAKKAASAGGKIAKDKFSIGQYGHIALVTDTEGNMIGLHSME